MAKIEWKPGNMLYPLPAVLVTSKGKDGSEDVCTVAWAGTVCTNPPMVSISLRPSRLSYTYIHETGVFGLNITTEEIVRETDFCGVKSGRDLDKFKEMKLKKERAAHIDCPLLAASPVNIECEVTEEKHPMNLVRELRGQEAVFLKAGDSLPFMPFLSAAWLLQAADAAAGL